MNDNSESSGQEDTSPTLPRQDPAQPEPDRASARPRSGTARVVADAVLSRTAGWMVAAALAGALTTLALEPSASTPTAARLIPVRNAASADGAAGPGRIHKPVRQQVKLPPGAYGMPGQMPGQIIGPAARCAAVMPGWPFPGQGRMVHRIGGIGKPRREVFIRPGRQRRFSISLVPAPACIFVAPGRCAMGAIGKVPARRFAILRPGGRPGQSGAPRPSRRFSYIPGGGPIGWPPMMPGCEFLPPQAVFPGR